MADPKLTKHSLDKELKNIVNKMTDALILQQDHEIVRAFKSPCGHWHDPSETESCLACQLKLISAKEPNATL